MMKFLGQSLERVKSSRRTMDNYNLFGVNMYLAGACEALGQDRKLDVRTSSVILGDAVQTMGYKKNQAQSFADNYVEYLVADSRYMQMYQAGRNAMNTSLGEDSSGAEHLEKALVEWNKPKSKEEKAGPVTVMFTDMVGSTSLTQTKGDAVAQQVVRAHNRIVREALNRYAGKEIKHTGDGIMASFAITSNGVEAAIMIQHAVVKHNEGNPELPLHLKVGINAGEPIAEDDDLFGTTVQVAARTVDKAKSEQIFVTEIVHGICAGKGLKFVNRGRFEMKGVAEAITLYEAVWDESILAADAAAEETKDGVAEEAADAADKPEVEPGDDAAKAAEDEAAAEKPDAEPAAEAEEPDADEQDAAPAAAEAAPAPAEEVAETGEAAETAPPEEPAETDEKSMPEDAQQPPAAEEPSAEPDEKPAAASQDKA
jgi:adenylate cyclase